MFKIIYLPTSDEVKISSTLRSKYPDTKEGLERIIHEYNAYNPGKNLFFLMSRPNSSKVSARRIPKHLLEVIEVPDV